MGGVADRGQNQAKICDFESAAVYLDGEEPIMSRSHLHFWSTSLECQKSERKCTTHIPSPHSLLDICPDPDIVWILLFLDQHLRAIRTLEIAAEIAGSP